MKCNKCPYFSTGKLKVVDRYNYGRNYYYIVLVKCNKMNSIMLTIKDQQGLEDIEIPDIVPDWNCLELQKLREKNEISHFEMSI